MNRNCLLRMVASTKHVRCKTAIREIRSHNKILTMPRFNLCLVGLDWEIQQAGHKILSFFKVIVTINVKASWHLP